MYDIYYNLDIDICHTYISEIKLEVKAVQEKYTQNIQNWTNEELVAEYQKTHNEEHLKMLMVKNRGIIYMIANSYSIPAYDTEDLLEEGFIALWKAADGYDPSRGYTFTTALKGFVQQTYNRLYANAHRIKRGNGEKFLSWEELEAMNRERSYTDDHTVLAMDEFLGHLAGITKKVATLLIEGLSKGEVAKALGVTPATTTYHIKKIQKAYIAYKEAF